MPDMSGVGQIPPTPQVVIAVRFATETGHRANGDFSPEAVIPKRFRFAVSHAQSWVVQTSSGWVGVRTLRSSESAN